MVSQRSSMEMKTILVVEDDPFAGEVMQLTLSIELPHHTKLVTSSREALEVVSHQQVTLFIIDYHLADMNGIDLSDVLHRNPTHEHVPTIITTDDLTHHQQALAERCLIGIPKPFDLDRLIETIEHVVG
ncbi:response regulator [Tengunoibacter tsumagoiensis]|uniref:Response regulatory domain-containing protein n=1 Tax=Tengunoibacter tsumagoiensis TaxID=2014871 RepID=A0A401ZXD3_9CHLR|nr:response regulator [Tengunoibacter tsumagoiensis]GCE11497.1 hypothetical protein KTT_13560 [Tengunoibacter tsumagoiensis]